jgi:hypothetical protein
MRKARRVTQIYFKKNAGKGIAGLCTSENNVPRTIYWLKNETAGEWEKLHNKKVNNLYSSFNIIWFFFLFYSYLHELGVLPCSHSELILKICIVQTVDRTTWKGGSGVFNASIHTKRPKHRRKDDIHALSGIRTHEPSVWQGENISCFWPPGHRDRKLTLWDAKNYWDLDFANCPVF